MLSRDSMQKAFLRRIRGEHNQLLLFSKLCLNPRGSNVSSHFMPLLKIPPTPPQCVWVGGQVWFHLLHNTAYYHSTEHKQRPFLSPQLLNWTRPQPWPRHGLQLTQCTWRLFSSHKQASIKYYPSHGSDSIYFIKCDNWVLLYSKHLCLHAVK